MGQRSGNLKLKRYLGDGVYAGFDGYQIWVWAERDGREHAVAFEAATLASLAKFRLRRYEVSVEPPEDAGSRAACGRLFVGLLLLRLLLVLPCLFLILPGADLALSGTIARRHVFLLFPGVLGTAPGHVLVIGLHENLASDGVGLRVRRSG